MKACLPYLLFFVVAIAHARSDHPPVCVSMSNELHIAQQLGALAKVVEQTGVPDIIAASGNGATSAFLLDSIALNPWVADEGEQRKTEVSFLVKSIPGFLSTLLADSEIKKAQQLAKADNTGEASTQPVPDPDSLGLFSSLVHLIKLSLRDPESPELTKIRNSNFFHELFSEDFKQYLTKSVELKEEWQEMPASEEKDERQTLLSYRAKQAADAISDIGKINEKTDSNLLFRPAILNHEGMVRLWDHMASFYAGYNYYTGLKMKFRKWLKHCAPLSKNKSFADVVQADPYCGEALDDLASRYIKIYDNVLSNSLRDCANDYDPNIERCAHYRYDDLLNGPIQTFVLTSVFVDDAAKSYLKLASEFEETTDRHFGAQFKLDFKKFRIGYYGDLASIQKVQKAYATQMADSSLRRIDFSQDFKAKATLALGQASWMEALTKSPAEAGQAKPKVIYDYAKTQLLSLGAWPDPAPMHLFKGLGCQNSIAILSSTQSGDNFGEHVMMKAFSNMANLEKPDISHQSVALANKDFSSEWAIWRRMASPPESEARSLQAADGIYCIQGYANDKAFDPSDDINSNLKKLMTMGYYGSLFVPEEVSQDHPVRKIASIPKIERSENVYSMTYNRPLYNGCIPPLLTLRPTIIAPKPFR